MSIRWSQKRKLEVVNAVHSGTLGLEEACVLYNLSAEEFDFWCRTLAPAGVLRDANAAQATQPAPHRQAYIDWAVTRDKD